ncbi:hypothetical protein [Streptomyces sp. RerS4]|uniref:hypothetical protein n=1 Tax=Streptomyces sp. RerS4 TaxID=2942449 RepID=UPI00201B9CBD|nr:hypothetical protein [Streptomyces sp. RerS4]UQX05422.1 hypothetical protein M4D82_33635 [Streptomyces sp. RerS4]
MLRTTWAACAVLVALLAFTGCAVLDDAPAPPTPTAPDPAPTYTQPPDWTEPTRWTALPRGWRKDELGSEVGFPHTTEGAVAMAMAANSVNVEGDRSTVDEQLRLYHSYLAVRDRAPEAVEKIKQTAVEVDATIAQQVGVKAGESLPPGAYLRNHVLGYKIIRESNDAVSLWLLTSVVQKAGELEKEESSFTGTLLGLQWQDGDWRLSGEVTIQAQKDTAGKAGPALVAPGDAAFNEAGWTAIRSAS